MSNWNFFPSHFQDKLNLTVQNRNIDCDNDANDAEPLLRNDSNWDLQPERVNDFHIFYNLVGLYHDILSEQSVSSHKQHFSNWINQLIEAFILKSLKYPLLSGFVTLLQVVLGISNRLDYFEEKSKIFGNDSNQSGNQTTFDAIHFYLSLNIQKAQQTSGELQIACLKLLFTAPTCMLRSFISDLIPVFQIALDIGKSNATLFIAEMAFQAFQRYLDTARSLDQPPGQKSNQTNELIQAVLPYFDVYLQSFKDDTFKCVRVTRARVLSAKRISQKQIKIDENKLLIFQKRIIHLLGSLEPDECQHLLQNSENAAILTKSCTTRMVGATISCEGAAASIPMDSLIPRICAIATSTTDRQKKITACEIIHATIIYLVRSDKDKNDLWSEMCDLMLELACDSDIGVQQMFKPLVRQIMHFMSSDSGMTTERSTILLKCLINAVSHPTNVCVRDFASKSLRQFLFWICQSKLYEFIITFAHQLKLFSSDMLPERRNGAARAFNNVFYVLRKKVSPVDKYWLRLLYDFCICFSISEQQSEPYANYYQMDLEQIACSLDHILSVLRRPNTIVNKNHGGNQSKTSEFQTLRDAIDWILRQCNSTQTEYRKKMMKMFMDLAPRLVEFSSPADFIQKTHTPESVIELCENGIEIESLESQQFTAIYLWLKRLHTTLDCYIWLIENRFMRDWQTIFQNSNIFDILQHYIEQIMTKSLFSNPCDLAFNSIEQDRLNAEKSEIFIAIFQFLSKTMAIGCVPSKIWKMPQIVDTIERCVFQPQLLECNTKNPEFLLKLRNSVTIFITQINRFAPNRFKNHLIDRLVRKACDIFQMFGDSIELSRDSISTSDASNLKGIDLICSLTWAKKKRVEKNRGKTRGGNFEQRTNVLAMKTLYQMFDGIAEPNEDGLKIAKHPLPDVLKFNNDLLKICFYRNGIHVNLIDLIMNKTELKLKHTTNTIVQGKHFLTLFKTTIYQFFLKTPDQSVTHLVSKMLPLNVPYVLHILVELMEYACKIGGTNREMQNLTDILLNEWPELLSRVKFAESEANTMNLIALMKHLMMIYPNDSSEIAIKAPKLAKWLLKLMKHNGSSIETKKQAILLLPCVIGPSVHEHPEVQQALKHIQQQYFPRSTRNLPSGSVERTTFENTIQILLDAMCASKSAVILKFIVECTVLDTDHSMDQNITRSLHKFITALAPEHQLQCLNTVFGLFLNSSLEASERLVRLNRFLTPLIFGSTKGSVCHFYASHIHDIETLLSTSYEQMMPGVSPVQAFTSRIGGWKLLEILSATLTRDELCDTESTIAFSKFGRSFNSFLMHFRLNFIGKRRLLRHFLGKLSILNFGCFFH